MRINEQKYILPDGREIVIKSAGPEDALKAKTNGFEQVELGVYSDNDRARHMYKKMGFKEYGMNPRAFKLKDGTYRDEIIMANIFE